jgi:hypothetical protein
LTDGCQSVRPAAASQFDRRLIKANAPSPQCHSKSQYAKPSFGSATPSKNHQSVRPAAASQFDRRLPVSSTGGCQSVRPVAASQFDWRLGGSQSVQPAAASQFDRRLRQ